MKKIVLPALYQDHMMLQREKKLEIAGQAEGITSLRAVLEMEMRMEESEGFLKLCQTACEVREGHFTLTLPALTPGVGRVLSFFADEDPDPVLVIRDILVGDIWLASGQSNMEYFLRYDADWNRVKRAPRNPLIRMYNVPRIAFEGQEETKDLSDSGYWFSEGDPAWATFSAPGYSFAREIAHTQKIPVGIIGCNWGGTPACAWMDEKYLEEEPLHVFMEEYQAETEKFSPQELKEQSLKANAFENDYRHELEWRSVMYGLTWEEQERWVKEHASDPVLPMGPWHHYRPCGLYHTMVETVAPFAIRGFLWYQGESDSGHAQIYHKTMEALIDCFRKTFRDEELPFLFVQLAPFHRWLECDGEGYVEVRLAQERVSKTVKGAYMASIMDLGDRDDIHPKFKMEVGRRLALLARGHVYQESLPCDPPEFKSAQVLGSELIITFTGAGSGLSMKEHGESGFELFLDGEPVEITGMSTDGDDLHLETDVMLEDGRVVLACGMSDYCELRIHNSEGLCIKPFVAVV